jgi:hypothetical protein
MALDDPTAHVPTKQENDLYAALMAGDRDTVNEMRDAAYEAEQELDEETGLTQAQQFDVDYGYAHERYQAAHEMPEEEREANTAQQVEEENAAAPDPEPEPEPEPNPDQEGFR